jgi:membrane protein YqaA with SNARE-associated domain
MIYAGLGYLLGALTGYAWGAHVQTRRQGLEERRTRERLERVLVQESEDAIDWGSIGL